ncbi:hypothetical protein FPG59_15265 [Flavobacterium sp. FPG59]|nr:hypothetical protein FPG59_15265 [Flavobacterium sp. FPG59]
MTKNYTSLCEYLAAFFRIMKVNFLSKHDFIFFPFTAVRNFPLLFSDFRKQLLLIQCRIIRVFANQNLQNNNVSFVMLPIEVELPKVLSKTCRQF